jgi:hypothetical protein
MGSYIVGCDSHFIKTRDITPGTTFSADTDMVLDVRGMNRKDILIKNAGATGIGYTILASLDDENLNHPGLTGTIAEVAAARMVNDVEYDVVHTAYTTLANAAQVRIAFTDLYTFMKIRTSSPGTTAIVIKANMSTN